MQAKRVPGSSSSEDEKKKRRAALNKALFGPVTTKFSIRCVGGSGKRLKREENVSRGLSSIRKREEKKETWNNPRITGYHQASGKEREQESFRAPKVRIKPASLIIEKQKEHIKSKIPI